MIDNKRVLVVIPARGGSKGIPRKNLQKIAGKTLVDWVANAVSKLKWVDRAVLSTDDQEIALEGITHGLDVPFFRPEHLSGDHVGSFEVVYHAVLECEKLESSKYDIVVVLEPTCPFRLPDEVTFTVERLVSTNADSAITVSMIPFHHHPAKALIIKNSQLEFYQSTGESVTHRQMLSPVYHRNGVAYAIKRDCLIQKKSLYGRHIEPVVIERELINIDNINDLEKAEHLWPLMPLRE